MSSKMKVDPLVVDELTSDDYSPSQLRDKLNEVLGGKTSGKKFTAQDINQYIKRGSLPIVYGSNNKIIVVLFKQKTYARIKI